MITIKEDILKNKKSFLLNVNREMFREDVTDNDKFYEKLFQFCKNKPTSSVDSYTFNPFSYLNIKLQVYKIQGFTFFWSNEKPNSFFEYGRYKEEVDFILNWTKQLFDIKKTKFNFQSDYGKGLNVIFKTEDILDLIDFNNFIKELLLDVHVYENRLISIVDNVKNEVDVLSIYGDIQKELALFELNKKPSLDYYFYDALERIHILKPKKTNQYKEYLTNIFLKHKRRLIEKFSYDVSFNPFWQFIETFINQLENNSQITPDSEKENKNPFDDLTEEEMNDLAYEAWLDEPVKTRKEVIELTKQPQKNKENKDSQLTTNQCVILLDKLGVVEYLEEQHGFYHKTEKANLIHKLIGKNSKNIKTAIEKLDKSKKELSDRFSDDIKKIDNLLKPTS